MYTTALHDILTISSATRLTLAPVQRKNKCVPKPRPASIMYPYLVIVLFVLPVDICVASVTKVNTDYFTRVAG